MKKGDKIKVHMYDCGGREIITRNHGIIFNVYEKNGKLGIDWNVDGCTSVNNGDTFVPFSSFAPAVIFEDAESGKKYHFSSFTNDIEEVSA